MFLLLLNTKSPWPLRQIQCIIAVIGYCLSLLILSSVLTLTSFFSANGQTPISVLVSNSVTNCPNKTYSTYVAYRGILLGGLRRLQDSNSGFR